MATTNSVIINMELQSAAFKAGIAAAKETSDGFFDGIKQQIGRGSFFGEAVEMAVGAGAFRAVNEASKMFEEMGKKVGEVFQQMHDGESAADITDSLMGSIPVLGHIYKGVEDIERALDGSNERMKEFSDYAKQVDFSEKFMHHLAEANKKLQVKADDDLQKAQQEQYISQLPKDKQDKAKVDTEYFNRMQELRKEDENNAATSAGVKFDYEKRLEALHEEAGNHFRDNDQTYYNQLKEQIGDTEQAEMNALKITADAHASTQKEIEAATIGHNAKLNDIAREQAEKKAELDKRAYEEHQRTMTEQKRKIDEQIHHFAEGWDKAVENVKKMWEKAQKEREEKQQHAAHQVVDKLADWSKKSLDVGAVDARFGAITSQTAGDKWHIDLVAAQKDSVAALDEIAKKLHLGIDINNLATAGGF